jgi:hypothetical protein
VLLQAQNLVQKVGCHLVKQHDFGDHAQGPAEVRLLLLAAEYWLA